LEVYSLDFGFAKVVRAAPQKPARLRLAPPADAPPQRGKAPVGKGRRPAASPKKLLPFGQALSRPKAVLFRG